MTAGYRELVGLQVTFSKATRHYHLAHYYHFRKDGVLGPTLSMKGYDLEVPDTNESIVESLRKAYAPAILSIWQLDAPTLTSEYLQFQIGATPADLHWNEDWRIFAQW